jgi:ornithine cyclodeaminase/alanine dehydrogenase-like protein (mu-crystallin family)
MLSDDDVQALLPAPGVLVDLAEEGLLALAEGRADVPPKPGVRTAANLRAHAMPAAFPERGLLGCKWIAVAPDNALRGLPTTSGVMIVNDSTTGIPRCVMSAAALTAARSAAVSGACLRALAPPGDVAVLGAGVQARSHLRMLAALGHLTARVWARRREPVDALASWAAEQAPGIRVIPARSREAAVRDAGSVISVLALGLTDTRLPSAWVRDDALLLPLDWASTVGPDLAETALLASDDVRQFVTVAAERTALGTYPAATTWTGHLLHAPRPRGRVVVHNLGSGLLDLLVGAAVADAADRAAR